MAIEKHVLERGRLAATPLVFALALGASACGAQDQPGAPKSSGAAESRNETAAPAKGTGEMVPKRDTDAAANAPDKKEKRGNTPPGTTRAGEAPSSGAIVDPAGVTKK